MSARTAAVELTSKHSHLQNNGQNKNTSDSFGCYVFTPEIMEKMLPREATENIKNARLGKEKLKAEYADAIAIAMREWAIGLGASHYCHLFQPLTGTTAEKHESFVDWKTDEIGIGKFSGQELLQGEPDASSFPSGGLRTTFEARGYTGWDPTSPVFIREAGDGFTLCIPSIFFSWTGDILDNKVPLLRSDAKINDAVLRLLKLTGVECTQVHATLGWEQEYFVIDRAMRNLRPDLIILGRTVFGAPPPKGQELQDYYFGSVKDRVLSYMKDFEEAALKLAIPVKTRHNEVAPAQHEVAPVFEKASLAVDHNIMLMELMRCTATKHDLTCLLHEKPFDGLNGSGKHNNWSLATDTGINLLNPSGINGNCTQFVILLTAILSAVHRHADLLRASIGSAGNDYRLGGHEAPPAVISAYLGDALEQALDNIVDKGQIGSDKAKGTYDFGLSAFPNLSRDNTDRNRTSPFAFTGNKFEFRAVGSSVSCSLPITVINVIVAESLNEILDEILSSLENKESPSMKEFIKSAIPVMQKHLKKSRNIRFSGDNYSEEWT
ncbi:MAG: glutamine synthetase, partial [Chlamydiales bacterium]